MEVQQQVEGEASNSSSAVTGITGTVAINNDNADATNYTLIVGYDLNGCEEKGSCSSVHIKERANYCEMVKIGDVDDDGGEEGGSYAILDNVDPQADSRISINVGKAINQLFGLPMVVKDGERRVRGCAIFTEIIANESSNTTAAEAETTAAEEETAVKDNTVNTSSGADITGGGAFVSVALVSFVSSILVVALTVAITAHY